LSLPSHILLFFSPGSISFLTPYLAPCSPLLRSGLCIFLPFSPGSIFFLIPHGLHILLSFYSSFVLFSTPLRAPYSSSYCVASPPPPPAYFLLLSLLRS
jgi:hypothetical protein